MENEQPKFLVSSYVEYYTKKIHFKTHSRKLGINVKRFLAKRELFLKRNRKIIMLFNVNAVEIEQVVEIEPSVLIEPF